MQLHKSSLSAQLVRFATTALLALAAGCSPTKQPQASPPLQSPAAAKPNTSTVNARTPSPEPNQFQETTLQKAFDSAQSAAATAKYAALSNDWNLVASQWEQAIALLKTVPAKHPKKALANKKIAEYQRNLVSAKKLRLNLLNKEIRQEISDCLNAIVNPEEISSLALEASSMQCVSKVAPSDFSGQIRFQQAMQLAFDSAQRAAKLSQSAQTAESWNLIASEWRRAIALLKTVPANHPKKALITKKIAEYKRNQNSAKQQKISIIGLETEQDIYNCVVYDVASIQSASKSEIEAAAKQCFNKIVLLDSDGSLRADASDRAIAVFKNLGINLPQPVSQGQATVKLQPIKGTSLFAVPVTIGGQSKSFLFDTGASTSVIDRQLARNLDIAETPVPSDLLRDIGVGDNCSEIKATSIDLPTLAVKNATVEGIQGMAFPKTAIPLDVSGILGMKFLSAFDVVVNPKTRQFQLLPPSSPSLGGIPLEGKMGVMTAQVYVNGEGPFIFLLDTGASGMVVSESLAQRLSLKISYAEGIPVQGVCGTQIGKLTKLERVSLQQHQLTNLEAIILDSGILDVLGVEGIVGQNFLTRYQQHWRFGERNELGEPEAGSLVLKPL